MGGSDVQPVASCHHVLPEVELLCPSPDGSLSPTACFWGCGLWAASCCLTKDQ